MADYLELPVTVLIGCVAFLDTMPGYIRALLAGLILARVLSFFEARIAEREVLFCLSFRKTSLTALLIVPLVVLLFPDTRIAVFVEQPPDRIDATPWWWLVVLWLWLPGVVITLAQQIKAYVHAAKNLNAAPEVAEQEKLLVRLPHWRNRLGMKRPVTLVETAGLEAWSLPISSRLGIPATVLHWPENLQDIVMIRELCHIRKHHSSWHLFAGFIACCYWPVTWVPKMHRRLQNGFQLSTDSLAESCYGDNLSYARGLRQLETRMSPPASIRQPVADAPDVETRRIADRLKDYVGDLKGLMNVNVQLRLDLDSLFESRSQRDEQIKVEPYEKVFWFIGQAVFAAMLITGTTLKQMPPEIERTYFLPFEFVWMENFHRNQERMEQQIADEEKEDVPE
jgi:hypothetical protein